MKRFLFSVFLILNHCFLYAQNFEWAKQFGEYYSMVTPICSDKDSLGNLFILGTFRGKTDFNTDTNIVTTISSNKYADIFLVKYDVTGSLVWANRFGSNTNMYSNEEPTSLKVDHAGNIIISGSFSDSIDFDPTVNTYYLQGQTGMNFFCKYSSSGQLLWAHAVDDCSNNCIEVDQQDNIYFTGSFFYSLDLSTFNGNNPLIGGNNKNGYIFKVNPAGNYLWAKSFSGHWSDVNAIKISKAGNVNVGGRFSGSVDFDPGPAIALEVTAPYMYYFHLTSLDSMGNYVWAQTVTCSNQFNYVAASACDSDDDIYL